MMLLADRCGVHLGRLTLTPEFLFLLSVSFTMDSVGVLGLFLLSATLHELGHLLCCRLLGVEVWRLRLTCCGGVLETAGQEDDLTQFLTALSGPLVNLLLSAALIPLAQTSEHWTTALGVNLMLGLFNLLPVLPLDGGRALGCVLRLWLSEERCSTVMTALSTALKGILFATGTALFLLGNPSLLVVAVVLLMTAEE